MCTHNNGHKFWGWSNGRVDKREAGPTIVEKRGTYGRIGYMAKAIYTRVSFQLSRDNVKDKTGGAEFASTIRFVARGGCPHRFDVIGRAAACTCISGQRHRAKTSPVEKMRRDCWAFLSARTALHRPEDLQPKILKRFDGKVEVKRR